MIPQRTLKLLDVISEHSEQLAKDGLIIFTNACKPAKERTCAGHDVTAERFKDLLRYIELFQESTNTKHFSQFIDNGFNSFEAGAEWAFVEQELYLAEQEQVLTQRGGSVLTAILNLAKTFFNNQSLWSPSRCAYGKSAIDISHMYLYPADWISEFNSLATKMLVHPRGQTKYKNAIGALLVAFKDSRNDPIVIAHIKNKGNFDEVIDKDELFNVLLANTADNNKSRLKKVRSVHNSDLHGESEHTT